MNSVHEQLPQTVTANSALNQNWVGCTVRTPRTQVAHTARAVPRSWALLRAQQAGRAHVARTASAGHAHAGRALVATRPGSLHPGRDLTSMSRHQGSQNHVATSNRCHDTTQTTPCRDIKSVSRHRFSCPTQARWRHQDQVATFLEMNLCRDINFMS